MRKFIHSKFQLDLSKYKITDTAENSWFTGTYFAKYSYPFTVPLTEELDAVFGFLENHNSTSKVTYFEGIYVHGNVMEKAVLEIEEVENDIQATLRYGLDDFPNFTKKLSELPLEKKQVSDIYIHAASVIGQAWPAVNYNFPQIHIDKITTEDSEVWGAFEKIINNYKNGAFLRNTVDLAEEITYNRNIIQPLPYALYLLKAGFAAAGFELKGDVLNNADLQTALIYTSTDYYYNVSQESIPILLMGDDYDTIVGGGKYAHITITRTYQINHPGRYRIIGSARIRAWFGHENSIRIYYRDVQVSSQVVRQPLLNYIDVHIDRVFETLDDGGSDTIKVVYDGGYVDTDVLLDLNINPIALHSDQGEVIPSIVNKNEVDLTRAVPDMTFGDFVKFILQEFNFDLDPRGSEIWINYIEKEFRTRNIIDLSSYEVKRPSRKYSTGNSWIFKYQDVESADYAYAHVYQDVNGITTEDYVKQEKTTEIVLNGLPLPLATRNNIQTAHGFIDDKSAPYIVIYNGKVNGLNLSQTANNFLVPQLHEKYYKSWMDSQLNAITYKWIFTADLETITNLQAKSRVHAYTNIHIVSTLQKTEVSPDLFEVEIETKILK